MLEDQGDNAKVMEDASSLDLKPRFVMKASHDAVSVDTKQALAPEVMLTRAGPEQAQERYAFMVILM